MIDARVTARTARRYPAQSVEMCLLADGRALLIRPFVARDAELLQDFVRRLSVTSRYQRFQSGMLELPADLLERLLAVDYWGSMAFGAFLFEHGNRRLIGEARYAPSLDDYGATEFALVVADAWQRRGVGRLLLDHLILYAERNGITRIQGDMLHDNIGMLALACQFGFLPRRHPDGAWLTRVERRCGAMPLAA
jgi:acetyltransferase